jgi:hypothetical protein
MTTTFPFLAATMTAGITAGRLLLDEKPLNRCAIVFVACLCLWLISAAWRNFRGK